MYNDPHYPPPPQGHGYPPPQDARGGYHQPPPHHAGGMPPPPFPGPPQHGSYGGAPAPQSYGAPSAGPLRNNPPMNVNFDRTVFIGNLPWDTTEQQLGDYCSTAGQVTAIRLLTDKQTGKGKGSAFVEFRDVLTAASAVRNLNNADFRGRALRVDFTDPAFRAKRAEQLSMGIAPPRGVGFNTGVTSVASSFENREKEELRRVFANTPAAAASSTPAAAPATATNTLNTTSSVSAPSAEARPSVAHITVGAQAPAVQPTAQAYGTDTIEKLVKSLTKPQLLEILSEMKKFAAANPDGARQLLFDSPQVAQTLLHILVLFDLIRPHDVAAITTTTRPVQGSVPHMQLPYASAAPAVAASLGLPPLPPLPGGAPVAAAAAPVTLTEQDRQMLEQIKNLSAEQIQALPEQVQQNIILLLEAQAKAAAQ